MLNNAATRAVIVGQIQSAQGAIAGQVTDALGGVGGVTINVFDSTGTTLLGSTLTDSTGYYHYDDVPVGAWQVSVTAPTGFTPDAAMKTTTVTNQSVAIVNFFLSNSVNGACGSASGQRFLTAPNSNLCSAGAASAVTGSGLFSWTCAGLNGGQTASCSARSKCDQNNDGKIDRNDISIIMSGRGLYRPGDPRDIDGDGWITVDDSRACTLQCTNKNCAP